MRELDDLGERTVDGTILARDVVRVAGPAVVVEGLSLVRFLGFESACEEVVVGTFSLSMPSLVMVSMVVCADYTGSGAIEVYLVRLVPRVLAGLLWGASLVLGA